MNMHLICNWFSILWWTVILLSS